MACSSALLLFLNRQTYMTYLSLAAKPVFQIGATDQSRGSLQSGSLSFESDLDSDYAEFSLALDTDFVNGECESLLAPVDYLTSQVDIVNARQEATEETSVTSSGSYSNLLSNYGITNRIIRFLMIKKRCVNLEKFLGLMFTLLFIFRLRFDLSLKLKYIKNQRNNLFRFCKI
jgi:hypothetical protein